MSTKAGRAAVFFPHPAQHRLVAHPEGARDAPDAHAVLVGGHHLILELLVVAGSFGLQDERALTIQALGSLVPVLGVTVLADALAAATLANVDDGRRNHPQTSDLIHLQATASLSLPDLDSRVEELSDIIQQQEKEALRQRRIMREIAQRKEEADAELNDLSRRYDSAYLSQALTLEKQAAKISQQLAELKRNELLIARIDSLRQRAEKFLTEENRVKDELRLARNQAERDIQNFNKLKNLFLDCLIRARIPGILATDHVEISSPNFLPEVYPSEGGELTSTSFSNLGSGGKKTLFKACFAVAIHRLAMERNANLPTLLIIDSPMKNISERVNRRQFEGFHEMLYSLANTELKGTQIILIDKELLEPPPDFSPSFQARFMTPDTDLNPPLITKYRGK